MPIFGDSSEDEINPYDDIIIYNPEDIDIDNLPDDDD